jgi:WD40 repeat protein
MLRSGARSTTPEGHSEWVTLVAFSPDGKPVASGLNVRLWERSCRH